MYVNISIVTYVYVFMHIYYVLTQGYATFSSSYSSVQHNLAEIIATEKVTKSNTLSLSMNPNAPLSRSRFKIALTSRDSSAVPLFLLVNPMQGGHYPSFPFHKF